MISKEDIVSALNVDPEKLQHKERTPNNPEPEQPTLVQESGKKDGEAQAPVSEKSDLPGDSFGLNLDGIMDEPKKEDKPSKVEEPVFDENTKDGRAFASMRKEIKELREKLEMAQSKPIEEPEEVKGLREQIKSKDDEIQKLLDQIGALDLSQDPRFISKYKQAESLIDTQIKDTAKELGIEESVIDEVLSYPLKKRVEYLNEEAGAAAPMLLTMFAQKDALIRQKQSELAKHKEVRQQLDQQRGVQELALEQQARSRLFSGALAAAKQNGHFVFQDSSDNPQKSELAKKAIKVAEELFVSNDGQKQAEAMMLGVAAPVYLHMLHLEHAKRLKAESELALRFGKKPSVGSSTNSGGVAHSKRVSDMTADEAAEALSARFS